MTLTASDFLTIADHTLLAPGTTEPELHRFLGEARELGAARVCISRRFSQWILSRSAILRS